MAALGVSSEPVLPEAAKEPALFGLSSDGVYCESWKREVVGAADAGRESACASD